jgi:hypothetical protein
VLQPETNKEYIFTGETKRDDYPDAPTYKQVRSKETGEVRWTTDLYNWKIKVSYKRPSIKKMVGNVFEYKSKREQHTFTLMHYEKDDFLALWHTHSDEWRISSTPANARWTTQSFYLALHNGTLKQLT